MFHSRLCVAEDTCGPTADCCPGYQKLGRVSSNFTRRRSDLCGSEAVVWCGPRNSCSVLIDARSDGLLRSAVRALCPLLPLLLSF